MILILWEFQNAFEKNHLLPVFVTHFDGFVKKQNFSEHILESIILAFFRLKLEIFLSKKVFKNVLIVY